MSIRRTHAWLCLCLVLLLVTMSAAASAPVRVAAESDPGVIPADKRVADAAPLSLPEPWALPAGAGAESAPGVALPGVCARTGDRFLSIDSDTYVQISHCRINAPAGGLLYIIADASLANIDGPFEAAFGLTVDGEVVSSSQRWVNVYPASFGANESAATMAVVQVGPGYHDIELVARRAAGTGVVGLHDPSLSVILLPPGSELLVCAESASAWTNGTASYTTVVSCEVTAPGPGTLFVTANASLGLYEIAGQPYEVRFALAMDGDEVEANSHRWVNVYDDDGAYTGSDGSDRIVAASFAFPAAPGPHTVALRGGLIEGTGPARVWRATIAALYVPDEAAAAATCSASGMSWAVNTALFPLYECTLTMPRDGYLLITGTSSVHPPTPPGRAWMSTAIDDIVRDGVTDRWADLHADSGDGSDKSMALTTLRRVSAGTHTIYLLGSPEPGGGDVTFLRPTLNVLGLWGWSWTYLPVVLR